MKVLGSFWIFLSIILILGADQGNGVGWGGLQPAPSETECRPYIERALKELETTPDSTAPVEEGTNVQNDSTENADSQEASTTEVTSSEDSQSTENADLTQPDSSEPTVTAESDEQVQESIESADFPSEAVQGTESYPEPTEDSVEVPVSEDPESTEESSPVEDETSIENIDTKEVESTEITDNQEQAESNEAEVSGEVPEETAEETEPEAKDSSGESAEVKSETENEVLSKEVEETAEEEVDSSKSTEDIPETAADEAKSTESKEEEAEVTENTNDVESSESKESETDVVSEEEKKAEDSSEKTEPIEEVEAEVPEEGSSEKGESEENVPADVETTQDSKESLEEEEGNEIKPEEGDSESPEEEELTMDIEIPKNLRPRDHIARILKLDSESNETEVALSKVADTTLKELKRLYDTAIKPLEMLYKYRDLSNRHFGDPEIFSKPLVLFMGPWSGGKSSMINYLLDNEFKKTALRTGAEPSPAYFNILMWGEEEAVLDGTQLAADWTFSGLQKFGQGLLDRLKGLKLKSPLLEKVNIVEIPGILEVRKQVERVFPFNDVCQWFIDRADIIFLIYDPSKLDVGPETEAILDQLKGREYQTRIILNKADQVKPEELMRVQGTLIWNISPLMSSAEPPIMYSTSLWSLPYESGTPTRLLLAQERAFLQDLRLAIERRVENKISSARRFAVRVRNHAKMVDCYLTTYYNHKSFFGNRKKIAEDIIERPQNYYIYEGLSTLTNISRYDLPDPEVYRDFFRLNPVYEFQRLSDTCTYFRGCPINRLDVAIAYDLPELVGRYKKAVDAVLTQTRKETSIS